MKLNQSGISLVSEDPARANMLYSLLWEKKGKTRGFDKIEDAFTRLGSNPTILADLREVADYQMSVTSCSGHMPYSLPLELYGHYTNNEIQSAFGRGAF